MDGQNVVFKFDHAAYVTQYEKPQWSSLHFAYCISYEQMMKLKRLDRLYLELTLEASDRKETRSLKGQK